MVNATTNIDKDVFRKKISEMKLTFGEHIQEEPAIIINVEMDHYLKTSKEYVITDKKDVCFTGIKRFVSLIQVEPFLMTTLGHAREIMRYEKKYFGSLYGDLK